MKKEDEIKLRKVAAETMKDSVALYANKSNALIRNEKCRISEDERIVPLWQEGTMMVPLAFFAESIGALPGENCDQQLISIHYQGIKAEIPPVILQDIIYVPLKRICRMLGLYCFSDESGLIIYGKKNLALTWAKDGALLRKIAESFIYEDVEGAEIVRLIKEKHPGQGHPRLIMTEEKFAAIRANLASDAPDPFYAAALKKIKAQADACLDKRATGYEIRDGVRLLYVAWEIKTKVLALAMTYQLTLDERYAERAWLELYNASCFVDWHPYHFLDTGEMTAAISFGYDWLYHWLGEDRRKLIREAIIENGFKPLIDDYEDNPRERTWNWRGGEPVNNWRFIAGGGVAVGAIALADELAGNDLLMCEKILSQSLLDIREPLSLFAPGGAYPEGINYWCYAMSYFTYHIGSLISATGKDFGYTDVPGIRHTTDFVLAVNGSASVFNYGDAGRMAASVGWPIMFFVHLYGDLSAARARINLMLHNSNGCTEDFFYYDPSFARKDASDTCKLDTYLQDSEVFASRSGHGKEDIYIAMHCGDNFADHGQYDMGTFVLDACGENFFLDLGADNYNIPNRFTEAYRYRAEGHNTIVIDPDSSAGQIFESTARIDKYESKEQGAFAVSDITSAYAHKAVKMQRGIRLDQGRSAAMVQDEVHLQKASDFWWFAHTEAEVKVDKDGRKAYLTKNGKTLLAEICHGEKAEFSVMDAVPMEHSPRPEGQADNAGIRKLVIHIPECKDLELAVQFSRHDGDVCAGNCDYSFVPLDEWSISE